MVALALQPGGWRVRPGEHHVHQVEDEFDSAAPASHPRLLRSSLLSAHCEGGCRIDPGAVGSWKGLPTALPAAPIRGASPHRLRWFGRRTTGTKGTGQARRHPTGDGCLRGQSTALPPLSFGATTPWEGSCREPDKDSPGSPGRTEPSCTAPTLCLASTSFCKGLLGGTHPSFGNRVDPSFVVSGLPVHGICSAGVETSGAYAEVTSVAALMVGLPRFARASG